ncbi:MAG TPA: CHAT domain-containing protein [Myxococcaceae bacterium]|nr:CHAT domain-containing protein [Myxococcaceae bacterium]
MTPEDHSGGPVRCDQLGAFVDGELDAAEAAAFRRHLLLCARCQQEMHGLMQLSALSEQAREQRPAARPDLAPVPVAAADRRARPRRAAWVGVVGAVAVAASLAVLLLPARGPPTAAMLLASRDSRRVSGWPSYAGAQEYRPYAVQRGGAADDVVLGVSKLEERQDWAGLASVALVRGEFKQAMAYLQRAPKDPRTRNDLGLALLELGQPEAALEALDLALREDPSLPQALFNRGLALERLHLDRAATSAFRLASAAAAGGWRAEADASLQRLQTRIATEADQARTLASVGQELAEEQRAPPGELLVRAPGALRRAFYSAVALAPSDARLAALLPTARDLDRPGQGRILESLVESTRRQANTTRWLLVPLLRPVLANPGPETVEQRHELAERARRAGQTDQLLLLASLSFEDTSLGFPRLAAASGDPFWQLRERARQVRAARLDGAPAPQATLARGDLKRWCGDPSLGGECANVLVELAQVDLRLGRPEQALGSIREASARARTAPNPVRDRALLLMEAQIQLQADRLAAASAIFQDVLLGDPGDCALEVFVGQQLANGFIERGDRFAARKAFDDSRRCAATIPASIYRARVATRLALLERTAASRSAALEVIRAAEKSGLPAQSSKDLALFRATVLAEADDASAAQVLRAALGGSAETAPGTGRPDPRESEDDLAVARTALVFWFLRRGEVEPALEGLAELGGTAAPASCVLGVASQYGRLGWVARGEDGRSTVVLDDSAPDAQRPAPVAIAEALGRCGSVGVLASASVLGRPRLLPPGAAWSFRTSPHPRRVPGPFRSRVRVRGTVLPPGLELPALAPGAGDDAGWTVLEGADATPSRVRASLQRADLVDFEVHGVIDAEMPDGALLVLSPESAGGYALTASAIEGMTLPGAPLVLLGACRAAARSPFRDRPWNLPASFSRAGARGVVASFSELPDATIGAFFERLVSRMEGGAELSVALRDERQAWLARGQAWVDDVVAFE